MELAGQEVNICNQKQSTTTRLEVRSDPHSPASYVSSIRDMLRSRYLAIADTASLRRILLLALIVRITVWFGMSVSSQVFPDHDPGADVHKFPLPTLGIEIGHMNAKTILFDKCPCSRSATKESRTVGVLVIGLQTVAYPFLLEPLTRWDAARFLNLAYHTDARMPVPLHDPMPGNDRDVMSGDETLPSHDPFSASEQAHAFLPLFPFLIRIMARILCFLTPRILLPASGEALFVLAGALLNILCFLVATIQLYRLTESIVRYHFHYQRNDKRRNEDIDRRSVVWANRVTLIFIANPANVFFTAVYSESLAAVLLLRGCCMAWEMLVSVSTNHSHTKVWWNQCRAAFWWWLASCARSNSILYGGFLLLFTMGSMLKVFHDNSPAHASRFIRYGFMFGMMIVLVAAIVFGSMGYHNYMGYQHHCHPTTARKPEWCSQGASFHLYGYVQRKHWNVGLFRYYQWKQIPNFLLAAPVLILSSMAVIRWIHESWARQTSIYFNKEKTASTMVQQARLVLVWATLALREFSGDTSIRELQSPIITKRDEDILVQSPFLLGFYAVLAASLLLGTVVAHVQISTRMICSSCPALYWYMAVVVTRNNHGRGELILVYCVAYITLGIILHPNWLPWT